MYNIIQHNINYSFYLQVDVPPKKKSKQSIINPELSNLVKSIKSKTKRSKLM